MKDDGALATLLLAAAAMAPQVGGVRTGKAGARPGGAARKDQKRRRTRRKAAKKARRKNRR